MKLVRVEIDHFKNILNSGPIEIQTDVTCIVGKNESGKTAVLHALHRFHPAQPNVSFNAQRQYPAWLEKQHRRQRNLDIHTPVTCYFSLEDPEWGIIEAHFGAGILKSREIKIMQTYENRLTWDIRLALNEQVVVGRVVKNEPLEGRPVPTNMSELTKLIDELRKSSYEDETKTKNEREAAERINDALSDIIGTSSLPDAIWQELAPFIPKFFYFDEYSQLPGSVKIRELLSKEKAHLSPSELTARVLLERAGADNEYLLDPDYETRKRELENIANDTTHQVLAYWSTNPELRTDIDITLKKETLPNGQERVLDELKIRLYDNRHLLSLPFEERSTGFRWFFSFLAAFSAYENGFDSCRNLAR